MKTIDLSDEEIEILAAVLRSYLSDLRMEIADTDSLEFRQILKRRKAGRRRRWHPCVRGRVRGRRWIPSSCGVGS